MSEFIRTVYSRISRSRSPSIVRDDTTLVSSQEHPEPNEQRSEGGVPQYPSDYLSVRVTIPHIDVRLFLEKVFSDIEYICYKHKGVKTEKEHIHVLVLDTSKKDVIRVRVNRAGFGGNKCYSLKGMHNGILCGIQYASKEGTHPIVSGPFDDYIKAAPAWKHQGSQQSIHSHFSLENNKPNLKLRDWQLTYTNIVSQAVHYAQVNKMGDCTLKEVVKDMISKTRWRPNKYMLAGGVPEFYKKDFLFRMGKSGTFNDMSWFDSKYEL